MNTLICRYLTPARLLLLSAFFSAATLSGALIGQYGFSLFPCHLCLLQRYPYAIIIALGLVGRFFIKNPSWHVRLAWLCVALFAVDAGIALYHTGVEMGIFAGPSGCTSSGKTGQTLEQIRAEIMGAPLVTCDQAMVYIFGLSMAAWNALAALSFGLLGAVCLRTLRKGQ